MRCEAVAERALNIPPSATVRIADAVAEKKRQGLSVVDFSAGRASEHTFDYLVRAATRAMQEGDTHQTMARRARWRELGLRSLDVVESPLRPF